MLLCTCCAALAGMLPAIAAACPALAAMCRMPASAVAEDPPAAPQQQHQQQRGQQQQQQQLHLSPEDTSQTVEQQQGKGDKLRAANCRIVARTLSRRLLQVWAALTQHLNKHYNNTFLSLVDDVLMPWRHQQCSQTLLPITQLVVALLTTRPQQCILPLTAAIAALDISSSSGNAGSSGSSSSSSADHRVTSTPARPRRLMSNSASSEDQIQSTVGLMIDDLAEMLLVGFLSDSSRPYMLQQLAAASPGELCSLWLMLFVKLAWAVDAAQQQGLCRPAAGESSSSSSSSTSTTVARFLAAAGAPNAPNASVQGTGEGDACDVAWLADLLAAMVNTGHEALQNAVEHNTGTGSSTIASEQRRNSSNEVRHAGAQPQPQCQLSQQLVAAVPVPEALLLLLEQLLLDPSCINSSENVIDVMLNALWDSEGAAAAAAAAAALLPLLLTQLPAAVLRAAAAVNCPGCNPQPAASSKDVENMKAMHMRLAMFIKGVVYYASALHEGEQGVYRSQAAMCIEA
jgi:hypothetical protein